jgi:hypothetical protein
MTWITSGSSSGAWPLWRFCSLSRLVLVATPHSQVRFGIGEVGSLAWAGLAFLSLRTIAPSRRGVQAPTQFAGLPTSANERSCLRWPLSAKPRGFPNEGVILGIVRSGRTTDRRRKSAPILSTSSSTITGFIVPASRRARTRRPRWAPT